jgi:hypothetical protein
VIIFPLKWLPWLLLIGGLVTLFSGESTFLSIVLMIVGGIWAYSQVSGNKKRVSSNSSNYSTGVNYNSTQSTYKTADTSTQCPNCRNIVSNEMSFCSKCGTRLR